MRRRRYATLLATFLLAAAALAHAADGGAVERPDSARVYDGLGSWVDIFAGPAWRDPAAVVASLRSHGVATLYLETSNSSQRRDIVDPAGAGRFLDAAHAAGMNVVAWYLPSLARPALDARRALAAIRFRSPGGEQFDSFALDIESSAVRSVPLRNARLLALARSLRFAAPSLPLGAIVPSPVGMARRPHYWPHFPFAALATTFDAFVPMAYFTYHAKTPAAAYAYARDVVLAIRRESAPNELPIHIIGGLANRAGVAAVEGFIRGATACGVAGISLYAFLQTSAAQWTHLREADLGAAPTAACMTQRR